MNETFMSPADGPVFPVFFPAGTSLLIRPYLYEETTPEIVDMFFG